MASDISAQTAFKLSCHTIWDQFRRLDDIKISLTVRKCWMMTPMMKKTPKKTSWFQNLSFPFLAQSYEQTMWKFTPKVKRPWVVFSSLIRVGLNYLHVLVGLCVVLTLQYGGEFQRLPDQTKPYQTLTTLPNFAKPYQTLTDQTRLYQTIPNFNRPHQTSPNHTKFCLPQPH